jgi:NAD(P)-dependent dehydrogenase (short-subunit alcohol dehydrogenase family)
MNVLVIGASRGIGLEFVRQYRAEGHRVTATARDDAALRRLGELGAEAFALDVAQAQSASGLAWRVDGAAFDVVVLNAGVYGPSLNAPETPAEADFDLVMHTNVLGPMRLIGQLGEAFAPGGKLAVLSSRMGSIGSRAGGNGWLYRASKAALNSVLKDASIVLAGKATCVAFHPGWVQTDMGGAGADLTPAQSVADLRRTIARLGAADNGRFLNHDGEEIVW